MIADARSAGLFILTVFPDSPAAKLGIRPGDLLPRPTDASAEGFEKAVLARISKGESIRLQRNQDGEAVEVTLPEAHASPPDGKTAEREQILGAPAP